MLLIVILLLILLLMKYLSKENYLADYGKYNMCGCRSIP